MSRLARTALALLVLTGFSACATGPTVPSNRPPTASRHVLANGIRVVIEEHRRSEVVALQLWVQAGARDETAGELGLAHYLEHLLFKGTITRPPGFIDREVEGVGGRMNAATSFDYTYYHMLLPAPRVLAGIETLADISVNASLDETLLEREKKVVLEEMRLSEDNPTRFLGRQLYSAAFDGHPYGRPIIGTTELIRGLTREQLLRFYRRHYVPEAFTLVVVGAVNPAEVLATATRAFGRLTRSGTGRLPPTTAEGRPRHVELQRPGSHAYIGLAWYAPKIDHADTPAVDLLVNILGQGRGSRLTRSLRERLGLVNTIATGYSALEGSGIVTLTAQLEPANLVEVEAQIWQEIRRVREAGVTAAELERARTAEEAQREFRAETAEGRAGVLGHAVTVWRLEEEEAYLHRLRAVTREQVQAAARRYLDLAHFARVVFRPQGSP
ncbi:MAG: M16 family metallopeptidase [Candidatus Rokuibacteriota bacterium]